MSDLVRVPYQPEYAGTPDTVDMLLRACKIAGHNIPLVDGWRPYSVQKYLYNGYIQHLPGFNLASNPDDPNAQNNHLRGAAWDIRDYGDRAAMLAAGFKPDAIEWWHFNNPNWRNMPIIKTMLDVADVSAMPLIQEVLMSKQLRVISSPSYRAAGTQVVHNGEKAIPFENNVCAVLREGGTDCHDYDTDDKLVTELNVMYQLAGLAAADAAQVTRDIVSSIIKG